MISRIVALLAQRGCHTGTSAPAAALLPLLLSPPQQQRLSSQLRQHGATAGVHTQPRQQEDALADVYRTAEAFARDELAPLGAELDRNSSFPAEALRKAASLGFGGIYVDESMGGSGLSRAAAAGCFERLAYGDVPTAAFLTIHNMVAWALDTFGSDTLRQKYLPALVRGDSFGSYCLTEPSAGSDAASLRTTATRDCDRYILHGSKAFISGAGVSDVYLVMARTSADPMGGSRGVSAFVVEKDWRGVSFGKRESKMGWHCQPTAAVHFDAVEVPEANRLGAEGDGFKIAMRALDGGRINIGACSVGGGQFCLDYAHRYVRERRQFGQPLDSFQATQFKLADMATNVQASRLLVAQAARSLDTRAASATMDAAMAKRFATDACYKVADDALQLLGGYGYLQDHPIERYVRDLRVHSILEGTNEIMRVIIHKEMVKNRKGL